MKTAIAIAGKNVPLQIRDVDVDSSPELAQLYGSEVPVLFINGRKAFKYRVAPEELEQRLRRERR